MKRSLTILLILMSFTSCMQKEVKNIDNNTNKMSEAAERIAKALEEYQKILLAAVETWKRSIEAQRKQPEKEYTEEDFNEEFDF